MKARSAIIATVFFVALFWVVLFGWVIKDPYFEYRVGQIDAPSYKAKCECYKPDTVFISVEKK